MDSIEQQRQQKQKYLREHIDAELYEDFADFCSQYAGQIDIDAWNFDFIKQLVQNFKEHQRKLDQNEDENHLERSFAIYQSSPGYMPQNNQNILENIKEDNPPLQIQRLQKVQKQEAKQIVKDNPQTFAKKKNKALQSPVSNKKSQMAVSPKVTRKQPQISTPPSKHDNNSSAVDLLDSVFEEVDRNQKPEENQKLQKSINQSFFNSVNFWEVPQVNTSPKKNEQSTVTQKAEKNKNTDFQAFNTGFPSPSSATNHQFNTFSIFTQQQIEKQKQSPKRGQNIKVTSTSNELKEKPKSKIKIKQIKQYGQASPQLQSKIATQSDFTQATRKQQNSQGKIKRIRKKSKQIISKIKYDGPKVLKNDFVDSVPCVKSAVRPNFKQKIIVKIAGYEVIQRSIFASDYIMYKLKVSPGDKIIQRNYEDFSKLRNILNKVYPVIQLPYLQKEGWISTTSPEYAQKQSEMLEFFIADILSNNQLRNSRIIQDFLAFPEHKKIKRKFEQYQKMAKILSIEEMCILSGSVEIALTEQQRINKEQLSKIQEKIENGLDRYKKQAQQLSSSYNQALSIQNHICDTLKEIENGIIEFNKRVTVKQIENLDQAFKAMRDSYQQNYMRLKFEKKVIDEDVLPFIRYERENIHLTKQILETCSSFTNKYIKRSATEQSPSTSYLSNALKQYKSGILEESKNFLVLKYQVGYIQAQTSQEMKRILENLAMKIHEKWAAIGSKYIDQFNGSIDRWNQLTV